MKTYIVFKDGKIGVIDKVCTCIQCQERGHPEIFIDDLQGHYLDCIKSNEVDDIVYFGNSVADACVELAKYYQNIIERKEKENSYLQSIIDFYSNKLIYK